MRKNKFVLPFVTATLLTLTSCNDYYVVGSSDDTLTLRQINQKYYYNDDFWLGTSSTLTNYLDLSDYSVGKILHQEFVKVNIQEECCQSFVLPTLGKTPIVSSMLQVIDYARKQGHLLSLNTSLSNAPSIWVQDPSRTNQELLTLLEKYWSAVASYAQSNNDVVKWMVMESYSSDRSSVWDKLGSTSVEVGGNKVVLPNSLIYSFKTANFLAPDVKKVLQMNMDNLDYGLFQHLQETILALRKLGHRVDGLQWSARVNLGWELQKDNLRQLERMIDWCYLNHVQFHITDLAVLATKKDQLTLLKATREEQKNTLLSLCKVVLCKSGQGVASCSFQPLDQYVEGFGCYGSLFENDSDKKRYVPTLAYQAIRSALLEKNAQKAL